MSRAQPHRRPRRHDRAHPFAREAAGAHAATPAAAAAGAAATSAAAAMPSFHRLAQVEVQLVMQHCDKITLLHLARCSRTTLAAASQSFAWRSLPPLELRCESPLELSSRVSPSLLRHAGLSVCWDMQPEPDVGSGDGAEHGGQTAEQWIARAETEAAAVAALPGLRSLKVWGRSGHAARVCSALLARLSDGGALASLQLLLLDNEFLQGDCQPLAEFVARSRTLTKVGINGRFAPGALRCLADGVRRSQSLATLSLTRSDLDDGDTAALGAAVGHCRTLTDLQLANCGIRDALVEALVTALDSDRCNIRSLVLTNNMFGPAGAASVARLLAAHVCAIEHLDLFGCLLQDTGAKSLAAALRTNRSLTRLQLEYCRIGEEGIAALTAALQSNPRIPLRHLDLSSNSIDATGATSLAGFLRANITLQQLGLNSCRLDDAALTALAAGLPAAGCSLRELRLSQNSFGAECAAALAAGIGACPSLTLLNVSNVRIGDGGMAALAPGLAHLRTLDVGGCGLTGNSAASLAALVQPGRLLHTLLLNGNPVGTAGVAALAAALQPSSALRTLHLWNCDVDAEGAAALGGALRRGWSAAQIQLGLNGRIGDDGARALAASLEQCASRCSLRELDLSSCRLTLAGVLPLVRAPTAVPSLSQLTLHNNPTIEAADESALLAACGPDAHFELLL